MNYEYRIWDKINKRYTRHLNIDMQGRIFYYHYEDKEYEIQENFIVELSTGKKDKKGKPIYESDEVISKLMRDGKQIGRTNTDIVEWYEVESSLMLGANKRHFNENLVLEVVGNIHDKE